MDTIEDLRERKDSQSLPSCHQIKSINATSTAISTSCLIFHHISSPLLWLSLTNAKLDWFLLSTSRSHITHFPLHSDQILNAADIPLPRNFPFQHSFSSHILLPREVLPSSYGIKSHDVKHPRRCPFATLPWVSQPYIQSIGHV